MLSLLALLGFNSICHLYAYNAYVLSDAPTARAVVGFHRPQQKPILYAPLRGYFNFSSLSSAASFCLSALRCISTLNANSSGRAARTNSVSGTLPIWRKKLPPKSSSCTKTSVGWYVAASGPRAEGRRSGESESGTRAAWSAVMRMSGVGADSLM